MKTLLKIACCLLLAVGFAACDKDDTTGNLTVTYLRTSDIASVVVIDQNDEQVYWSGYSGSKFTLHLPQGDYRIRTSLHGSSGTLYDFRISNGRTTLISYDENMKATVTYR